MELRGCFRRTLVRCYMRGACAVEPGRAGNPPLSTLLLLAPFKGWFLVAGGVVFEDDVSDVFRYASHILTRCKFSDRCWRKPLATAIVGLYSRQGSISVEDRYCDQQPFKWTFNYQFSFFVEHSCGKREETWLS